MAAWPATSPSTPTSIGRSWASARRSRRPIGSARRSRPPAGSKNTTTSTPPSAERPTATCAPIHRATAICPSPCSTRATNCRSGRNGPFATRSFPARCSRPTTPWCAATWPCSRPRSSEGMVYGTGWAAEGIWGYFGSFYGHAWLWLGDGQKAAAGALCLRQSCFAAAGMAGRASTAGQGLHPRWATCRTTGPAPSSSAWCDTCSILERGDELHLLEGMPAAWAKPGAVTRLKAMPTEFGPMSLEVRGGRGRERRRGCGWNRPRAAARGASCSTWAAGPAATPKQRWNCPPPAQSSELLRSDNPQSPIPPPPHTFSTAGQRRGHGVIEEAVELLRRIGCCRERTALVSICRTRSRVTEKILPTSSSV